MTSCVAYTRVSTERQAGEDKTSLADQRAAIERLGGTLGHSVQRWFADEGVSGGTAEKRNGFMALVAFCEAHRRKSGGVVLALNDSRWGRFDNPEEATYWRVHLGKLGWAVRFVEGDDVQDVLGRGVIRFVHQAQSTAYRQNIIANAKRGARGTAELGYWGRREPFGFRRKVVSGGKVRVLEPGERKADTEKVKLVPFEPEAKLVREAFRRYANGATLGQLNNWLREVSPDRRQWSRPVVGVLLKNAAYVGDVVFGMRCNSGPSSVQVTRDAHPAIVTRDVFQRAQERLTSNRRATRRVQAVYPVSGLVRCADCGNHYTGAGGKGQTMYRYYMDRGVYPKYDAGQRVTPCPGRAGMIRKEALEDAIVGILVRELGRTSVRAEVEKAVDRWIERHTATVKDATQEATKRLAEIERERGRVASAIASGTLLESEAAAVLRSLRLESERLAVVATPRPLPSRYDRARLVAKALDFPNAVKSLKGPALRDAIAAWVDSATFDKHTRTLRVAVRRVPGVLELSPLPRQTRLKQDCVVRSIRIPSGTLRRGAVA